MIVIEIWKTWPIDSSGLFFSRFDHARRRLKSCISSWNVWSVIEWNLMQLAMILCQIFEFQSIFIEHFKFTNRTCAYSTKCEKFSIHWMNTRLCTFSSTKYIPLWDTCLWFSCTKQRFELCFCHRISFLLFYLVELEEMLLCLELSFKAIEIYSFLRSFRLSCI